MTASAGSADEDVKRVADRRRPARMSRILRFLVGITALTHIPVAFGVAELARRMGWPRPALVGLCLAVAGILLFVGRARAGMPDRKGRGLAIVRLVDIPYFIHWCACVWTLVPSVLATVLVPVIDEVRGVPPHLPTTVFMVAYLSGLAVCGYGILVRRRWYRVVERDVSVPGLDRRFDGLRIAQLSDLHIGTMTPRSWGLRWSRSANARSPDLAVVTGDMVTSGTDFYEDVADVVGALKARDGVFVSMGNHDYFGEGEPLITLLRARGVGVLRNEGVVIEREGAKLWLAAIDDTWTRRDDIARAMQGRPDGATTVLLAHDPNRFDQAADAGANLVLSGHTHGGQIGVPFLYRIANLATFGYPYNIGFYRRGQSVLYVHPGLGTTGPPMRLGVPPEVTILVLRAA
ncbi:MAG TPA: metallophosphoesterase [Polyangiaceae bacterium]